MRPDEMSSGLSNTWRSTMPVWNSTIQEYPSASS